MIGKQGMIPYKIPQRKKVCNLNTLDVKFNIQQIPQFLKYSSIDILGLLFVVKHVIQHDLFFFSSTTHELRMKST